MPQVPTITGHTLRVQVPNYHILSKIVTYIYNYYPKTEHPIIGSFGPLGIRPLLEGLGGGGVLERIYFKLKGVAVLYTHVTGAFSSLMDDLVRRM